GRLGLARGPVGGAVSGGAVLAGRATRLPEADASAPTVNASSMFIALTGNAYQDRAGRGGPYAPSPLFLVGATYTQGDGFSRLTTRTHSAWSRVPLRG